MKKTLLYLLSLLLLSVTFGTAQTPKNEELAAEIKRLYEIDQSVQTDIVTAFQNGADKAKMDALFQIKDDTFKKHIPILKEIIRKYGFPTFDLVGKEASNNFFTMIQHSDSDIEFQKACLKLIEKQVRKKQVNPTNYAYLTDRVNLNSGAPQIYGTQLTYDQAGNALPRNLRDAKNVNKKRIPIGLEPIEDYLRKMTELHKAQNKQN